MAIFNGNIFSRARNSIGGVTFLKNRTRSGTALTARERVIPTDRKTSQQMAQRDKLKYAVDVQRLITTPELKPGWNRAVSKLPAYQSFMSYLLNSMDKTKSTPHLGSFLPTVGDGLLGDIRKTEAEIQTPGYVDYSASTTVNYTMPSLGTWVLFVIGKERNDSATPSIYTQIETNTAPSNVGSFFRLDQDPTDYNGAIFIAQYTNSALSGRKGYTTISATNIT